MTKPPADDSLRIDRGIVNGIKRVLESRAEQVAVREVTPLTPTAFGASHTGQLLGNDAELAHQHVLSSMYRTYTGLNGFSEGLTAAERGMTKADEESSEDLRLIEGALGAVTSKFWDAARSIPDGRNVSRPIDTTAPVLDSAADGADLALGEAAEAAGAVDSDMGTEADQGGDPQPAVDQGEVDTPFEYGIVTDQEPSDDGWPGGPDVSGAGTETVPTSAETTADPTTADPAATEPTTQPTTAPASGPTTGGVIQ